jgi:CubicO group peptidase (beta-lactamase class C family)
VALKLIDAGKLGLDEAVYQYHVDEDIKDSPELEQLTVRHLLSHQSGFPNWRYLTDSDKLRFEFEPGDRFQYSGEGFEYLRKVLEAKFNKPLEELAEELIFDPLEMNDTHFYWSEEIDESRYALEHDEEGKALSINKNKEANGAANLMTTVKDYATFMTYVLNGAELSKELYSQMISKQASVKEGVDFGLGWKIFPNLGNGEFALQHGGGDYGLKTLAVLFPESDRGILIFTNSENGMVVWKKILEEYFGSIGNKLVHKNLR